MVTIKQTQEKYRYPVVTISQTHEKYSYAAVSMSGEWNPEDEFAPVAVYHIRQQSDTKLLESCHSAGLGLPCGV